MADPGAWPLLSTLLAMPLCTAGLAAVDRRASRVRWIALTGALLTLFWALLIVAVFDRQDSGFQFVESADWIPGVKIRFLVGVDGISLLFLPATALLFCAALVAGWRVGSSAASLAAGPYFAWLLLLEAATLGVFCALDTMLLFFFWELMLPPLYFLISLWGSGPARELVARRYFLIMLAGGVPLLFGLLAAALSFPGGAVAFDLPTLQDRDLSGPTAYLVFLLLFAAFAVKVPVVPLHTWLPSLAMVAPPAVIALLVGLKLGAYGLIRFAIPLAPLAARDLHWLIAGAGAATILYAGTAALVHGNLRAILAYSSVAHVGLVVLGLATFSVSALQGALLQLLNFSLATGGGFLVLAFLQRRSGSTDVDRLGGIVARMPRLTAFFLLFAMSGLGMPGTSGFPGELLIVVAALHSHTGAGLAALFGMILAAAGFLSPFRKAFLGVPHNPDIALADDLLPRELACLLVPAALTVAIGVWPMPLLELLRPAAEAWVTTVAGL